MSMEEEIESALSTLDKGELAVLMSPNEAVEIVSRIKAVFIKGNPAELWHCFSTPVKMIETDDDDDVEKELLSVFKDFKLVYIIIEYDVYDNIYYSIKIEPSLIIPLLKNCQYVTYYVVDFSYKILMCENDHNQLMLTVA